MATLSAPVRVSAVSSVSTTMQAQHLQHAAAALRRQALDLVSAAHVFTHSRRRALPLLTMFMAELSIQSVSAELLRPNYASLQGAQEGAEQ
eukprot:CAMPEP_0206226258 /NCGR_PEP_ID=MMETSP0047_2-20121206/7983_1 /ASSEMBLY_ACC=CAM_ASM_000192 /TAXON_ID=195065 /ORGANISM="Chroomonas mesostigmatica_cf, Strain CCMP1168" /LENGTH=90 /DNA_ID=CAMNT_0053649309 /DNA_START=325 /DNA_END=597 /DNA_ORIENTATION=+